MKQLNSTLIVYYRMIKQTPEVDTIAVPYKGRTFQLEYFYRAGYKETILFIHGLGGAKENFWEACKTDSLAEHTLICFDNPGTGNSTYYDDIALSVDDLTAITGLFVKQLNLPRFILAGTSMGGLTALLYLQNKIDRVKAYVNIEGNLMPEDCMFSSKVVNHSYEAFSKDIFPKVISDMKKNGNTGYHVISNNLELNTNIKSYYHYSFQTVKYSATGDLLKQFVALEIPKIFIHGDENCTLSYLPELSEKGVNIKSISNANHFVFYDNPKELYDVIGNFVDSVQ